MNGIHTPFIHAWMSNMSAKDVWAPLLIDIQKQDTLNGVMQSKYVME